MKTGSRVLCWAAAALLLAGCAAPAINAQWNDPQFAGKSLRGQTVLVSCQANDPTLRRVCADRSAARLTSMGAMPVLAEDNGNPGMEVGADAAALLQQARAARAAAVLRTSVAPEATAVSSGPTIGIGFGGVSTGSRSGTGVGFGMSAPVGAGSVETGYGASGSLTDVASGKLMWSARANAPPSSDAGAQMATLTQLLLDSARQAGFFPA